MYKLDKLSISDVKAIFDYANNKIEFYQELTPDQVSTMTVTQTELVAKDFEFYLDVSTESEKVLDERIKQLFKP